MRCFVALSVLALCGLAPAWALEASAPAAATVTVRVLVEENQGLMRLEVKAPFRVRTLPDLKTVMQGPSLARTEAAPTRSGIRLGKSEWPARGLLVEPLKDREIYLDGSRFRGVLFIFRDKHGTLFAVNHLDIEKYLYGVLHHEVAHWWPMEALKVQAVASRTYAYYQTRASRAADYDVKSTTHSQVYGGSNVERYRVKGAVDQTKGRILTYQGKVFPAYFHSVCAGLTAGADEFWNIRVTPVAGGVPCGFCRFSPHTRWDFKMPLAEIEEQLEKHGRGVGRLLNAAVITQTPSHRAGSLRFTGTGGEAVIAAKDFRVWVGGNRMRSTRFTIRIEDDAARFEGTGWGHGVGMCQWGTLMQAILRKGHEDILRFYYPGSEIGRIQAGA